MREKKRPRGKEREEESRKGEQERDALTRTKQGYLRKVKVTAELNDRSLNEQV